MSFNHLAVVVSAILAYGFGFLWYNVIFREPYAADLARTKEWMDAGPSALVASVLQIVGNIVAAYVLSWMISRTSSDSAVGGAKIGFLAWLGFVASIIGPMFAFQAYSLRFFAIVAGGWLLTLIGMGALLGVWRK
jgi:hypothetical protein